MSSGLRASLRPTMESSITQARSELRSGVLVDGRYRVRRRLGAGAMGVVYLVDDVSLERVAALKMVEPGLVHHQLVVARLLDEARALARVRHDNVAAIYAFGMHGEHPFFVMEYVDGDNLDEILERRATLTISEAVPLVAGIAAGLSAAHAEHIVHGDVKPSNVVVDRATKRAVIIDFGISRRLTALSRGAQLVGGTPAYMAPEQVRGDETSVGAQTDLYGLACTAFEMLVGRPVYEAATPELVMAAHAETLAPRMSSVRRAYAALDPVFERALSKRPADRHDSCDAFASELAGAASRVARAASSGTLPPPSRTARVLLLAEGTTARALMRETKRALAGAGWAADIECLSSASSLLGAVARGDGSLVVIDDDSAAGAARELFERLDGARGGRPLPAVRLTREALDAASSSTGAGRVHRVPKPFSAKAYAAALELACAGLSPAEP